MMSSLASRTAAMLLTATALAPLSQAQAASCAAAGSLPLAIGTVADVAPGAVRSFSLSLGANEGVIVDLSSLKPPAAAATSRADGDGEGDEHARSSQSVTHSLKLCDAQGALLAPQPGEVFEKGGSVSASPDGERLRFVAERAGNYILSADASDQPREILARRRNAGASPPPVISAQLDSSQKGITSSKAPMVFSFSATAGQWVLLKSTSEKDTVLRLAGPDRTSNYAQIAENDDSDGLNPVIRRKLATTGTYYLQVDSLSDEPGEFELSLKRADAPKPPTPPMALRTGAQISGGLADGDDVRLYTFPVVAGHSYRLDLTATYDGVVAIGLPNPVEPDDGGEKPDAGFTEIKSQDSGTTGTEKLNFTARSTGQLMVRVKSFGIGETNGAYSLKATDLGA
jgi:hypothetical protein